MNDLRLLANFVAVYRHRSFRAAADELGMGQSSVTKRVQTLENELGLRLFNRTTRTVEPTDSARQLIVAAENTLRTSAAFHEEARLLAGGEMGAIRVGATALAAETLVVGALARLAATHPNLEVEVVVGSSDIYRDLASGECDVAVGDEANFESSSYASALRMERIHTETLVYVHRPDHPAAGAARLARLLAFPLAIPSRYFNENKLFETLATQTDPPAHPSYRLNSLSACLTLAAISNTIALAPLSFVSRATDRTGVAIANFDTGINVSVALVTLAKNTPTPAVRAFGAALSQTG